MTGLALALDALRVGQVIIGDLAVLGSEL